MLQLIDNFSMYGTNPAFMLNGVYVDNGQCSLVADPGPETDAPVLLVQSNNFTTSGDRFALSGAQAVVGMAFRIWYDTLPNLNTNLRNRVAQVMDNAAIELASIRINTVGQIMAFANGVEVGATAGPVIVANGWQHIEVKFTQGGATNCEIEVHVEGLTVLELTGLTFTNTNAIAQTRHGNTTDGAGFFTAYYVKDSVIWDGTGTYNNDFVGTVIVQSLIPESDEALNWLPSSGANGYSILDNSPPVDATYITAINPPPAPYVATLSNLPADVTSVKGIMSFVRAAKSDGGDANLQVGMLSGASTALGSDRPISVTQTYWRDLFEVDPATAAPWLPGAVDAARLQINRTV